MSVTRGSCADVATACGVLLLRVLWRGGLPPSVCLQRVPDELQQAALRGESISLPVRAFSLWDTSTLLWDEPQVRSDSGYTAAF